MNLKLTGVDVKKIALIIFPILLLSIAFGYVIPKTKELQEKSRYEFELNSFDGKVKLSDFRDKVVAIYFGYTYCPDICPTSLTILSQALNKLSVNELKEIQPIFISVDPDRDKLKHLKDYSKYFHPKLIGLTSDNKTIKKIAHNYGTKYEKVDLNSSSIGYSVAHTSYIYILDRDGKFNSVIQPSTPDKLSKKIKKAILQD